jgi:L-asparaginase II
MNSERLVNVTRNGVLESIHCGHLIIVDGNGKTVASIGKPETVTFFRSAAKPFQLFPFLISCGAKKFNFTEAEIALACGSHSGEAFHTQTAANILEKIGLSESDLRCGLHAPFNEKTSNLLIRNDQKPTQLHNNCSGKHSAMLAYCKHLNLEISNYNSYEHLLQIEILEIIKRFCEVSDVKLGIDGCAAPNFALPISSMAKSFAKLVFPPKDFNENEQNACRTIVSAMTNFPEMVGGTDRIDTLIMQELKGQIICKVGAEGIWLAGVLPCEKYPTGLGIAVKIEDGEDYRARVVIATEILRQLEILPKTSLNQYSPLKLNNRRGDEVGEVVASFKI